MKHPICSFAFETVNKRINKKEKNALISVLPLVSQFKTLLLTCGSGDSVWEGEAGELQGEAEPCPLVYQNRNCSSALSGADQASGMQKERSGLMATGTGHLGQLPYL